MKIYEFTIIASSFDIYDNKGTFLLHILVKTIVKIKPITNMQFQL